VTSISGVVTIGQVDVTELETRTPHTEFPLAVSVLVEEQLIGEPYVAENDSTAPGASVALVKTMVLAAG